VAGELDHKYVAIGRRMAHAIGPRARLAVIDGAGHAAHLERPDEFVHVLTS
jgi:2-succinyl-6-hydroxy-2,4-cyclohexadiene-1-carboxylate synthase